MSEFDILLKGDESTTFWFLTPLRRIIDRQWPGLDRVSRMNTLKSLFKTKDVTVNGCRRETYTVNCGRSSVVVTNIRSVNALLHRFHDYVSL